MPLSVYVLFTDLYGRGPLRLLTHPDGAVMSVMTRSSWVNENSLTFDRQNHGLAD